MRHRLSMLYGWTCTYCGDSLSDATATLDHVKPKSKGGTFHHSNLVLACGPCNWRRADGPA